MLPTLASLFRHSPSPLEELESPTLRRAGVRLLLKRDDLLRMGPGLALCGNKWRKLQYNLQAARDKGQETLLTFGGAYSNHIAAVAAAGATFGFRTIGLIRGERPEGLNPTLRFAEACGMELHYLSRPAFREKQQPEFLDQLKEQFGAFYLLPEGGTNDLALHGCRHIVEEVEQQADCFPDYWCCSLGTGGTFAGIIIGLDGRAKALGFSALKGDFLAEEVAQLLDASQAPLLSPIRGKDWEVNGNFHFGGYAKFEPYLIDFINGFRQQHGIALEPVYTGKLFYGIFQLAEEGYFPKGSTILAVHTGGLQGVAGFNERFGELIA
ncbi:MAG: pyridoxal-phosphate dependent enzyme [Lewinellaceae bacterium]|nr:pyridoxal-phosphate dependent enzyme [Phaeodactylibacter sp.]MCB9036983.1 pyridoxal-phosphate dependent enzyme [Lewinellaceae bacterium]